MGYAGIQTMLLTYKMRKADKEFELAEISNNYTQAVAKSSAVNDELKQVKASLDSTDEDYGYQLEALDEHYGDELAEIAAWEDDLQQQQSNCQTEISQLDGYISSWEKALQTNIQKAHSYGPSASG